MPDPVPRSAPRAPTVGGGVATRTDCDTPWFQAVGAERERLGAERQVLAGQCRVVLEGTDSYNAQNRAALSRLLDHIDTQLRAIDRKHVCNGCGHSFWAPERSISNPAAAVRMLPGVSAPMPAVPATDRIALDRSRYSAFAIWGSNPAILWTFPHRESSGIHVHAWDLAGQLVADETFGAVEVEGHALDAEQVRALMIQRAQPHLDGRIVALRCPACDAAHFDTGLASLVPANTKVCTSCGHCWVTPRRRKVVANPLLALIERLDL